MKNILLLLFASSLIIVSCGKSDPETFQESITANTPITMLGFDDLEIGDEFRYELLELENYFDENNPNFEKLKDTLVLEVCGINGDKYVISERITEGSAMNTSPTPYYNYVDSTFTNYWILRNDSLLFEQKGDNTFISHLFLRRPFGISLNEFTENETEMYGWKIAEPAGEFIGEYYIENGTVGGNMYPHMNVLVNNYAMAADGPGYMYFYNRPDGILRTTSYSAWTGQGHGWERISD